MIGEALEYSVAEYFYERLLRNGYASMASADEANTKKYYERRALYFSVLDCAEKSQALFGLEDGEEYVTNLLYCHGEEAAGLEFALLSGGDITLSHDGTKHPGRSVVGWKIIEILPGAKTQTKNISTPTAKLTLEHPMLITPCFEITDAYAAQLADDEAMLEKRWAALEEAAGEDIASAIKTLYTLYDDDMVELAASLYSPGYIDLEKGYWAGGYYWTASGRDNIGLGPDLESTVQMLRFIQQSGMIEHYGNNLTRALPKWMQYQLVYFAKTLNSPNGYFYHPQWAVEAQNASNHVRGRMLGWGTSLLSIFGSKPTYNTANGVSGDGITADEYLELMGVEKGDITGGVQRISPVCLTNPLRSGGVSLCVARAISADTASKLSPGAYNQSYNQSEDLSSLTDLLSLDGEGEALSAILASAAVGTASSSSSIEVMPFIQSHASFAKYLEEEIIMDVNPYSDGNALNAASGEIGARSKILGAYASPEGTPEEEKPWYEGMTLKEMMIAHMTSKIDPETGMWGKAWREYNAQLDAAGDTTTRRKTGHDFINTNSLLKCLGTYTNAGVMYPYPVLAAKGLLAGMMSDEPSTGNICELYNLWAATTSLISNVKNCAPSDIRDETISIIREYLAEYGDEAIMNTYEKLKGYKRPDGGFNHSVNGNCGYSSGSITKSMGEYESNVDAICIGTTGLVRSIFETLGYTRVPIFTKSDWMRYINIIETAEPSLKLDISASNIDFEDGVIPEDITVTQAAWVVKNGETHALSLEEGELRIARSPLSNKGSAAILNVDIKPGDSGDISFSFYAGDELALSFDITADGRLLTLGDSEMEFEKMFNLCVEIETCADGGLLAYINVDGMLVATAEIPELSDHDLITEARISADIPILIENINFVRSNSTVSRYDTLPSGNVLRITTPREENTIGVCELNGESVLHYHREINESGTQSYIDFGRTQRVSSANTVIFATDMMIADVKRATDLSFVLMPRAAQHSDRVYKMTLHINGSDIYMNDSSYSGSSTSKIDLGVDVGEWFNLRIEYYEGDISSEKNSTYAILIYINGRIARVSQTVYGRLRDAQDLDTLRFAPLTAFLGDIYFDNTSLAQTVKSASEVEDDAVDGEEIYQSSCLTFDEMPVNIKFTSGGDEGNTATVREVDGEKMLSFKKNQGKKQSYFDLSLTYFDSNSSAVIFETDVSFAGVTSFANIDFVLMPSGASHAKRTYKLTFTLSGDDLYINDSVYGGASSEKIDTGLSKNEKFRLKMKYHEANDARGAFVEIYINDNLVHTSDDAYGVFGDAESVNCLRFAPFTAVAGEVLFDNMILVQIAK